MLANVPVATVPGDLPRRWMRDDYFDLIVWHEPEGGAIRGFQLCYDKPGRERALTWLPGRGFRHCAIDSGEALPTEHRTPTLGRTSDDFPADAVKREFAFRSALLDGETRMLVLQKIAEFAASR